MTNDQRAVMRQKVALRAAASRHAIGLDQTVRGGRWSTAAPLPSSLR